MGMTKEEVKLVCEVVDEMKRGLEAVADGLLVRIKALEAKVVAIEMVRAELSPRVNDVRWHKERDADREKALQALHDENVKLGLYEELPSLMEAEPTAWWYEDELPEGYPYDAMFEKSRVIDGVRMFPVNVTPQRTWVGLTDEEIADCAEKMEASDPTDSFWREFFRGIEAKLKEKNGYE